MKTTDTHIRIATLDDAEEIVKIYAPYVTDTAISFEYDVPGVEEFKERMRNVLKKYPFLVAENDGEILGYANTHPFVGRAAYDWSAETTIYVKQDNKKAGIGKMLYQALEEISKEQNILNMNACIGWPEQEDEHLTKNSVQFHEHMGYRMVGEFHKSGYKFGTWYSMVWMEKLIGTHTENPKPVIPFPELDKEVLVRLGLK